MLFLALPSRHLIIANTPEQAVVAMLNAKLLPIEETIRLRLIPIPDANVQNIYPLTPAIITELIDAE